MACPDFEDLIREGRGGHAEYCEDCRALLEALADVDRAFECAFAQSSAPPRLAAAVLARVRRPSILPEALDLIGWAAIIALAAVLLPQFLRMVTRLTDLLAG